jgi:hypothetical protein
MMFWLGQKIANLGRVVRLDDSSLVLESNNHKTKTRISYLKIEKFLKKMKDDAQKGRFKP